MWTKSKKIRYNFTTYFVQRIDINADNSSSVSCLYSAWMTLRCMCVNLIARGFWLYRHYILLLYSYYIILILLLYYIISSGNKRRKTEENREFHRDLTQSFVFIYNTNGLPTRLICHKKQAYNKKSNLERHFNTKHTQFANKYPTGDTRKKLSTNLKIQNSSQVPC